MTGLPLYCWKALRSVPDCFSTASCHRPQSPPAQTSEPINNRNPPENPERKRQDEKRHMPRYVIIGAGAVGASLAAQFALSGIDYALFGRGAQISHIRQHGLTFQRPAETRQIDLKVFDLADLPELTPDDILLLTVKAQDAVSALAFWSWQSVSNTTTPAAANLPVVRALRAAGRIYPHTSSCLDVNRALRFRRQILPVQAVSKRRTSHQRPDPDFARRLVGCRLSYRRLVVRHFRPLGRTAG